MDGIVVGAGGGLTAAPVELENGEHFLQEVKGVNSVEFGPFTSVGEQMNGGPLNKKVGQSQGHCSSSECLTGHSSR